MLIEKTLQSVFEQSVAVHEVFLVDDGSTDDTKDRVEAFRSRHSAVRHKLHYLFQRNQGKSVALNAALERARGDWIAFNDSDDIWRPDKLEWQFRALDECEGCNACFTDARYINNPGLTTTSFALADKPLENRIGRIDDPVRLITCSTRHGIFMQSLLVRRTAMTRVGQFDVDLRVGQDTDFIFRLALQTPFCYVNLPLVDIDRTPHRTTGLTTEFAQKSLRRIESRERIFDTWHRLLPNADPDLQARVRRLRASVQSEYATWHILNDNAARARVHQQRAVALHPTIRAAGKLFLILAAPQHLKRRLAPNAPELTVSA